MRSMIAQTADVIRRLIACRRGANAIEMALVLPVLTLMIVGAMYTGWMLYATNMLVYSTESAARCAAVNTTLCGTTAKIQAFAVELSLGVNVTAANFTVTQPSCGWMVKAAYTFTFMMPFYTNLSVPINAAACYPSQP
jgi:Flp pilus assembly protein TadG